MTSARSKWSVEFYTDRRSKSDIGEFINRLRVRDPPRLRNALRLLREFGVLLKLPHARHIEREPWELRAGAIRLLYLAHTRRRFIILHGFRKKTRRTPRREIAIAERRMAELLEGEQWS